jgi:PTH1 family peptidyl-tRNA hydrolase
MKLVVGLGNPERSYNGTRHNVGFEVIDQLASRLGWTKPGDFDRVARTKFDGLAFDGVVGNEKLVLLKPTTYMNLSGRSVQSAMAFYQLSPADIMVVLDDLALPWAACGSAGRAVREATTALKDIERALATSDYPRLRIGIDPAPPRVAGKDYVLGKFTPEQRQLLEPTLARACGAIVTWIDKGLNAAMNEFNVASEKSDGVTE